MGILRLGRAVGLGTAVALLGVTSAQAATARNLGPLTPVADGVSALSGAREMGTVPDQTAATALVSIQHRDETGLLAFISAVSTPGNPDYGHYLSAARFDARFAPSATTVQSVERYLTSYGLTVAAVPANRAYVVVDGDAGQMSAAFATHIDYYLRGGMIDHAPVSALEIPRSLAGVITGVTGLDSGDVDTPQLSTATASPATGHTTTAASVAPAGATTTTGTTETSPLDTPPYPAYVNAPPFSSYFDSSPATQAPGYGSSSTLGNVIEGYTPQQIEGAYGVSRAIAGGLNGQGETVAVIDAYSSPTIDSDVDEWSALHDLPPVDLTVEDTTAEREQPDAPAVPTDVPILGGADVLDPSGWFGEETLDIEAVHTMAPEAHIIMQGAASPENETLEEAQNAVVSADQAQEVSNSYAGDGDGTDPTSDGYWQQAAAEGMGVEFSTGDEGDNTDGETELADQSVNTDPNSPYVTAVGGTTLAIGASDDYEWETYWGDDTATDSDNRWGTLSFDGGGGGGVSQYYAEPSWQKAVVPSALADYWQTYQPQSSADNAAASPCTAGEDPGTAGCAVYPGRVLPDVAMLADPNTGFQIGLSEDDSVYGDPGAIALPTDSDSYGQFRIGGTSLASPLFAGMMALADQAAAKPLGFADPALYALYARDHAAFHTIDATAPVPGITRTNYTNSVNADSGTQTVLRTFDNAYTLSTAAGYNDATGLGSPDGLAFICGITGDSAAAAGVAGSPCARGATGAKGSAPTGSSTATRGCRLARTLSFAQHPARGTRTVRAVVYLDSHRVRTIAARRISAVAVARPTAARYTLRYVVTLSSGEVISHQYTYDGCARSRPLVRVLRPARRR